ncbi:hypothetical protein AB0H10_38380, partial [Streptomyces longwoodensis]
MIPAETVAVELAELRGEIRTGLEQIKGQLNVLVARTERTDEDLKQPHSTLGGVLLGAITAHAGRPLPECLAESIRAVR